MGNDVAAWRASVGLYYNKRQQLRKSYSYCTYPFKHLYLNIKCFITLLWYFIKLGLCTIENTTSDVRFTLQIVMTLALSFLNLSAQRHQLSNEYTLLLRYYEPFSIVQSNGRSVKLLLILAGDVETNPGPFNDIGCLSILHQNIRSIRNKFDYVKDNFLDFDIICFTETHLTTDIDSLSLQLDGFDKLFRKDLSAHSGGLAIYASSNFRPKRIDHLENILPESIWIEIKDHSKSYLICTTYRAPHTTVDYWDRLNVCLEQAAELCPNVILTGDINEDQLNLSNHKFRDILNLNNMSNLIEEPTRVTELSHTLLDPIAISSNVNSLNVGILKTDRTISDHYATTIFISIDIISNEPFKRRVWNYKRADFNRLNDIIRTTDWSFLQTGNIDSATSLFITKFS